MGKALERKGLGRECGGLVWRLDLHPAAPTPPPSRSSHLRPVVRPELLQASPSLPVCSPPSSSYLHLTGCSPSLLISPP